MKRGDRRRNSNVDYWSEKNWAGVITGVREFLPTARVIICGAPAELPIAEDIVTLLPARREDVIAAANELPLPRLLALQARAHSMISVNSGPAHSAAAMGCPLLVMFTRHAHRAADLYSPVPTTAPVKILQPENSTADAGLDAIDPRSVVAAWRELVGV
jgi:heptosyltransferase-3